MQKQFRQIFKMNSYQLSGGVWKYPVSILVTLFFCISVFVSGSVIKVENGVYKRITVKVNDDVSSCHCDQVIENIQVSSVKSQTARKSKEPF